MSFSAKFLRHPLKKQSFLKNVKSQKLFQFSKKGDKENVGNYRRISILPICSKVLERIMYSHLYECFKNNNLLHENQFDFQINNSNGHEILQFTRDNTQNFDNAKFALGVFIDLSEVFDTVDHQILLKNLNYYGVNEKILMWLQSYLFQRKQYIENNDDIKYLFKIDYGVPQVSILSSLLFLVCVNNFYLPSKLKNVMFADNTNLFISDEKMGKFFQLMNKKCLYLF